MNATTVRNFGIFIAIAAAYVALVQNGCVPIPGPGPSPQDRAIKTEGPAVAVVEETSARARLTPEQLAILTDTQWRNYVTSKGGQFRVLDKDATFTDPQDPFKVAIDLERSSLPWLIVSTDNGDTSVPLPASISDMMLLLKESLE